MGPRQRQCNCNLNTTILELFSWPLQLTTGQRDATGPAAGTRSSYLAASYFFVPGPPQQSLFVWRMGAHQVGSIGPLFARERSHWRRNPVGSRNPLHAIIVHELAERNLAGFASQWRWRRRRPLAVFQVSSVFGGQTRAGAASHLCFTHTQAISWRRRRCRFCWASGCALDETTLTGGLIP